MLALSLWQPWATYMADGLKMVETRHWSTHIRGWFAIHAAKTTQGMDNLRHLYDVVFHKLFTRRQELKTLAQALNRYFASPRGESFSFGAIVAVGKLADCRQIPPNHQGPPQLVNAGSMPLERHDVEALEQQQGSWPAAPAAEEKEPDFPRLSLQETLLGDYTPGRFGWIFERVIKLKTPVECNGGQGFWTVPVGIEEEVLARLQLAGIRIGE